MKVRVSKPVDVDVVVDVNAEDIMATLAEMLNGCPNDQIQALDWATRILANIPVESLDHVKEDSVRLESRKIARERLKAWKDVLFTTDDDVLDATNLICDVAIKRLPQDYRLSLVVEDGQASIELEDTFEGEGIELETPDGSAWLDAIATAWDHWIEDQDKGL